MKIKFKYDYDVKVYTTDGFSGFNSIHTERVRAGETSGPVTVRPSCLMVGNKKHPSKGLLMMNHPQRSNITILGALHPDVMIDVPNDIFEII